MRKTLAAAHAAALLTALTAATLTAAPVRANDMPTTPVANAENKDYAAGRSAVGRKDWPAAVASFTKVVAAEPNNADAHNLLAYSYRWQGKYDDAFSHYERALSINPDHRGALEYQGVAFVKTGQIDKAEGNLARLEKIAGRNAEETRDLAKAIAEAKAKK
jgi:tetratricopeptide (TPR) repeat protein